MGQEHLRVLLLERVLATSSSLSVRQESIRAKVLTVSILTLTKLAVVDDQSLLALRQRAGSDSAVPRARVGDSSGKQREEKKGKEKRNSALWTASTNTWVELYLFKKYLPPKARLVGRCSGCLPLPPLSPPTRLASRQLPVGPRRFSEMLHVLYCPYQYGERNRNQVSSNVISRTLMDSMKSSGITAEMASHLPGVRTSLD